mmetsp:Transcript_34775/g.46139  ORF Transcript_34775/g.46139 Transcript_34775/m.46139 type:complete len:935 (-) Transcript_34775:537-3341(-)
MLNNMSDDKGEATGSVAEGTTDNQKKSTEPNTEEGTSSPASGRGEREGDKPANDSLRDGDPAAETAEKQIDSSAESGNEEGNDKEGGSQKESSVKKVSPADWPLFKIKDYHANDVLYGRGGGTNHHPGNKRYRKLVDERKADYINSKRLDKPLVALGIIKMWREQDPPGRFLKHDEKTGLWNDVGDKKAREKTSQALREKAPTMRKENDRGKGEEKDSGDNDSDTKESKDGSPTSAERQTRFNVPNASPLTDAEKKIKANKRLVLRRDHSLGRDYIKDDQPITLNGFSWNDPLENMFGTGGSDSGLRRVSDPGYQTSRREGWDSAFEGPRNKSLPTSISPPSLRSQSKIAEDADFRSMKPPSTRIGRRNHSLVKNPLPGANISIPARNPFEDDRSGEEGWGAPPPYRSKFTQQTNGNKRYSSDESRRERSPNHNRSSAPSRLVNNDGGASAFSRPHDGSAFVRKTSGGRGHPRMYSSSNSSTTEENGDPRFVQNPPGQAHHNRQSYSRDSGMSDDYLRVADMMGGGMQASLRRSWSESNEDTQPPLHRSWSESNEDTQPPLRRGWHESNEDYSMGTHAPRVDNSGGSRSSRGSRYSPDNVPPTGNIFQQSGQYSPRSPTQSANPGQDYDRIDYGGAGYAHSPPSNRRDYDMERRRSEGHESKYPGDDRYSSFSSPAAAPPSPSRKQSLQSIGKTLRRDVKRPSLIRKLSGGSVPQPSAFPQDRQRMSSLPKPNAIKRNTSNQNETTETRMKGIKRAVLSRDHSLASRALKQSMGMEPLTPAVFDNGTEEEMERLGSDFGRSRLNDTPRNSSTFSDDFRRMKKPEMQRTSTIEAVHHAFREGFVDRPSPVVRNTTIDIIADELLATEARTVNQTSKPMSLSANDRTSTIDAIAMDMVSRDREGIHLSSIENLALVDNLENDPLIGPAVPPDNRAR